MQHYYRLPPPAGSEMKLCHILQGLAYVLWVWVIWQGPQGRQWSVKTDKARPRGVGAPTWPALLCWGTGGEGQLSTFIPVSLGSSMWLDCSFQSITHCPLCCGGAENRCAWFFHYITAIHFNTSQATIRKRVTVCNVIKHINHYSKYILT